MADLALTNPGAATDHIDARRSTRIFQSVPLTVSGINEVGNPFLEMTSVVAFNCHGCLFRSRYHSRPGSWITLHMPNADTGKAMPVRALVRFLRLPASPTELYQVGVELESPSNVWKIPSPPSDWLTFSGTVADTPAIEEKAGLHAVPSNGGSANSRLQNAELAASAPRAPQSEGKPVRVIVSSDQLLQRLEGKLQEAAERALTTAMSARFGAVVNHAAKALDDFNQSSVRKVHKQVEQYREEMVISAREQFLSRVQADLASAEERLQQRVEELLGRAEAAAQRLDDNVAKKDLAVADVEDSFRKGALRAEHEFAARAGQIAARTEAHLGERLSQVGDAQIGRLDEQAQNIASAAAKQVQAKSDETRAQLIGIAGTALAELHVAAKAEVDRAVGESRRKATASLASFTEDTTETWEARLRACQDELAQTSAKEVEAFRARLAAILNTSMIAATSAVSEHAQALLSLLTKDSEPAEARREAS